MMGSSGQLEWLGALFAFPGFPLLGAGWWFTARRSRHPGGMHFAFPLPWLAMLMLSGFLLAPQTPPGEEPGPGDGIGLLFPLMSAGLTLVAYVLAALVSAVTKRLSGGPPASVVALQLDRIA